MRADLEDRHHVGVREAGHHPRLSGQPRDLLLAHGTAMHLERDVAIELEVLGEEHGAHAAAAEEPVDPVRPVHDVTLAERGAERGRIAAGCRGHGGQERVELRAGLGHRRGCVVLRGIREPSGRRLVRSPHSASVAVKPPGSPGFSSRGRGEKKSTRPPSHPLGRGSIGRPETTT
jgi:hypothetical protein